MELTGERRKSALAVRQRHRRRRRIGIAGTISLLIHIMIGVLLLVTIRREEKSELLPPPAPVTMVFESGRKTGPTLPEASLQATPPTPPAPPVQEKPLPTPPLPPPPPAPRSAPTEQPPPTVAAPTPAPEPAPVQQPPSAIRPPPKAPPVRPPSRQAAPAKPPEFPPPMNFSLGNPVVPAPARPQSRPHIPGTIDMSLGPAMKGTANVTPFSNRDEETDGADWRNALSRWVAEHAYYPDQARRNGEEGDVKVRVVAEPNGRVTLVELIGKSGSMWLDLALLALFRDQHIPPLPYGEKEAIEFNFTMHYVLIRR